MRTTDTQFTTASEVSGFDLVTCVTSILSLLASAGVSLLIVPTIRGGFYGGTALMVFIVLLFQVATLLLAVGLPSLVMAVRRRFRLSRTGRLLLALAVAGIAFEAFALWIIPVTGVS